MCGIFGYIGQRPEAASVVFAGLKFLEYRGYDSWGIAVVDSQGKLEIKKQVGKIGADNVDFLQKGKMAIGHTRWATHGGVTKANAHPHQDCQGKWVIVHNGIVENSEELKAELLQLGHQFVSETDSEVIAHLLEQKNTTLDDDEAVRRVVKKITGYNALVAIKTGVDKLYVYRQGSPLVIGQTKDARLVASDPQALAQVTGKVYFLEDGELVILDSKIERVEQVHKKDNFSRVVWSKFEIGAEKKSSNRFSSLMEKEIYEQPDVLDRVRKTGQKEIENARKLLQTNHGKIWLVGSGSSYFTCVLGGQMFGKVGGVLAWPVVSSEYKNWIDLTSYGDVAIVVSQSGETMDALEAIRSMKQRGVKIVALVNVLGSSIDRISDLTIPVSAGPERAVASTKAFIATISRFTQIAYGFDKADVLIRQFSRTIRSILGENVRNKIRVLAEEAAKANFILVLGKGAGYVLALEGALKFKEISYIPAEGLMAGEMKHGPLALVSAGTPLIFIATNDENMKQLENAMREAKARGGKIVGIGGMKAVPVIDYHIAVDYGQGENWGGVVVMQLLALFTAQKRNLDPDKPRNLAKSVTVR